LGPFIKLAWVPVGGKEGAKAIFPHGSGAHFKTSEGKKKKKKKKKLQHIVFPCGPPP
jgi:hypothetical protein